MGIILSVLSNIMYLSEKFTMCLAAVTVVSCLVVTLVMMLGLGVGLGYNYCFVEIKTKHRYIPGYYRYKVKEATTMHRTPPWRRLTTRRYALRDPDTSEPLIDYKPPEFDHIANETSKETQTETNSTVEVNTETTNEMAVDVTETATYESENTNKMPSTTTKTVIQIQGLDLIALLSKLKSENRNYSLQIVTT
ncbi:uncharacterized protein LOC114356895 [Ostrinia furnacalis]|uniref:uncharacterized protein LOC114356895 n=1 Tax=Ostrinia furnacalis TaxID=93504 RepID=UPI00103D7B90|nr:uncharacterized protein LOC114356895 [Ostrinia furnacalis]